MKRKVLITGVAGFIGSRLAEKLNDSGYDVEGCDIYNFRNQFFDVGDAGHLSLQRIRNDRLVRFIKKNQIPYHLIDLSDFDAVMQMFKTVKPEIVIHLAAQAGVRHSVRAPIDFVRSNLTGFANVLEASRQNGISEFLYASSSSVYGARNDAPFLESDRCDTPESFYAATKMANEAMAKAYFAQYKMPSIGLRFFTVYGPWGRLDMAPIMFAQKMRNQQTIQLFGHGLLRRDFTFIEDTVFVIEKLIRQQPCKGRAEVLNVGHSQPVQLTEFVQTLAACLNVKPNIDLVGMQVSDVPLTCASNEKLIEYIGEWPRTSLQNGLAQLSDWLMEWSPLFPTHRSH